MKKFTIYLLCLFLMIASAASGDSVFKRSTKGSPLTWAEMDANMSIIESLQAAFAGGTFGFTTKTAMDADLAHPAGTLAIVTNDTTPSNNTYWIKLGASGSGSWQKSDYFYLNADNLYTGTVPVARLAAIPESALSLTDVTTGNVSSTAHGFAPKSTSDTTKYLRNGTTPSWETVDAATVGGYAVGEVVNVTYAETVSQSDLTATIPLDNTEPQNTEGTEVLITASITPKSASNLLVIRYKVLATSSIATHLICALFEGSTAGAIDASHKVLTANLADFITGEITISAASTSARTYALRIGPDATNGGHIYFNGGAAGTAYFNGRKRSMLSVTEIAN